MKKVTRLPGSWLNQRPADRGKYYRFAYIDREGLTECMVFHCIDDKVSKGLTKVTETPNYHCHAIGIAYVTYDTNLEPCGYAIPS